MSSGRRAHSFGAPPIVSHIHDVGTSGRLPRHARCTLPRAHPVCRELQTFETCGGAVHHSAIELDVYDVCVPAIAGLMEAPLRLREPLRDHAKGMFRSV